ncbi:MAG: DEAD/DEAH box helicase, partial [Pseudonocardia sp.]|nr:DEAD/DEAH box helicase [Pseudonocardia sp.]
VYRVLRAMEDSGRVRRGYVIDGLGAAQFAVPGAIDRLRALSRPVGADIPAAGSGAGAGTGAGQVAAPTDGAPDGGEALPTRWTGVQERAGPSAVVLAAADPAQPYGAALAWPPTVGENPHRPGRKAGSLVVLVDGALVLYVERGGRSLLSFTAERDVLGTAARALSGAVHEGWLGSLAVERADGGASLTSEVAEVLTAAGFRVTPKGLRLRA